MLITPADWIRSFVGQQGKSRDEMVEAAWRTFRWDPNVVDDAIRDAAASGDIEQAVFARGLVRDATSERSNTSPDRVFHKKSRAKWRVK